MEHKEEIKEYQLEHKEEIKKRSKEYNIKHKEESKKYSKEYNSKKKQEAVQYKGGKCQLCGYDKYSGALEFHHIDPTQKDFAIGKNHSASFASLKPELDKCVLLCANCHREVHANLQNIEAILP